MKHFTATKFLLVLSLFALEHFLMEPLYALTHSHYKTDHIIPSFDVQSF